MVYLSDFKIAITAQPGVAQQLTIDLVAQQLSINPGTKKSLALGCWLNPK